MGRRSHADDFAGPEDGAFKDLDPEDEGDAFDDSASDGSQGSNDGVFDGREHYEQVGKSKLRKGQPAAIGPQYRGSRVSRDQLADESDEHDFLDGQDMMDDQSASDEDADGSDGFGGLDGIGSEDDDEDEDEDEDEDKEDEDEDLDNSEAATDDTSLHDEQPVDRAKLKSLLNDTGRSVAATMAAASAADASKGRAVKSQRATFDSLLNTRIRLQHALIASNSTLAVPTEAEQHEKAYEGAELAALRLLDSLCSLRDSLPSQTTGHKRKRSPFTASTSSPELWAVLSQQDTASQANERAVIQKWSRKTASASATAIRSADRLKPLDQTTLLDVLDSHLAPNNMPRHIERTKLARSCAPIQQTQGRGTAKSEEADEATGHGSTHSVDDVYDDADFYGVLLKELLEARNANAAVDYAAAANVEAQYRAARAAKSHSRPGADRRASKGRRLRYAVHERLQNWMAPEERGAWPARQRDELFASLFGQRLELREDEEEAEREDEDDTGREEEALMLFRS